MMRQRAAGCLSVWVLVMVFLTGVVSSPLEASTNETGNTAVNPACPDYKVFFNPGNGEDIIVPLGFQIEVFATGLNFPTGIAFRGTAQAFEVFVTEAGTRLPGRCNGAEFYARQTESPDAENPFLPQVRVLNQSGKTLRVLGRPHTVEQREEANVLHSPPLGITFERGFDGGRLFVSDSLQGARGELSPTNSSRIVDLDPTTGELTALITGLPTGDHPTAQLTVREGFLYWAQGSATNSGVVGHDNGASVGGEPNLATQRDIPCGDVVLSGNNFDSGDGHVTGGFLPHGVPGQEGQVVSAFSSATQPGMCTGAILRARLEAPQQTVEPFSWGYGDLFGLRFAPANHPLNGALVVSERGEKERGARPVFRAPDRIHTTQGGLDYHGWPDRFGFLDSGEFVFFPFGGPVDDNPEAVKGRPVESVLLFPPQSPISPRVIKAPLTEVGGFDFVPATFAGGGTAGVVTQQVEVSPFDTGDIVFTEEDNGNADLDDSSLNALRNSPPRGSQTIRFFPDGGVQTEKFAFNCRAEHQVTDPDGRRLCSKPATQAFVAGIRGFNRLIDAKFGPDGALYMVDFGAAQDVNLPNPDALYVQIQGTGVIWRISRIGTTIP